MPDRDNKSSQRTTAELEAELSAARKTIRALLDKAERRERALEAKAAIFGDSNAPPARLSEIDALSEDVRDASQGAEKLPQPETDSLRSTSRALIESERQLRKKNVELKQMNKMKGEFISIAAHELRTPLTSIVGYLDLMAEGRFGELPKAVERPVASVRRNAYRLVRLVNEMLDVSRIEAGKIVLHRQVIDLAVIARDVVSDLSPLADTRSQSLELDYDGPVRLRADSDKVHQIISNLVANAIRYTPEKGAIRVTVDEPSEARFAGPWARVRVRDNGIGIPLEERSKIFEPFSDAHSAKHHTSYGPDSAGLGLYIARGLVDLHGGIISVDSEEAVFTEFTVLLPQRLETD